MLDFVTPKQASINALFAFATLAHRPNRRFVIVLGVSALPTTNSHYRSLVCIGDPVRMTNAFYVLAGVSPAIAHSLLGGSRFSHFNGRTPRGADYFVIFFTSYERMALLFSPERTYFFFFFLEPVFSCSLPTSCQLCRSWKPSKLQESKPFDMRSMSFTICPSST